MISLQHFTSGSTLNCELNSSRELISHSAIYTTNKMRHGDLVSRLCQILRKEQTKHIKAAYLCRTCIDILKKGVENRVGC